MNTNTFYEKRKFERHPSVHIINFTCQVAEADLTGQGMGRTLNVSESGLLIETPIPLNPQSILDMNIGLKEDLLYFKGKVIHTEKRASQDFFSGIRLLSSDKSAFQSYRRHLELLRSTTPSADREVPLPRIEGFPVDYLYVVDEETFRDGDQIVEAGHFGDWIWVILEGEVELWRHTTHGPVALMELGEGAFVGNIGSVVLRNHPRSTTVRAKGRVQLGLIDNQRLSAEYSALSPEFKTLIWSINDRLNRTTGRMAGMRANNQRPAKSLDTSSEIVQLAQQSAGLYLINEGQAAIMRHTAHELVHLMLLRKGEMFGEIPFLDMAMEPRRAVVVGSKGFQTKPIATNHLQREYAGLSATFRNLLDFKARRIAATCDCIVALSGAGH